MKIKFTGIIFFITLSGCNCNESQTHQKESGLPDIMPYAVSDEGIVIYWESELDPVLIEAYHPSIYDLWLDELEACLGMKAEPPIVRIVDDVHSVCKNLTQDNGGYCRSLEPSVIVINVKIAFDDGLTGDVLEDRRVFKHESTHHVLELNGVLIHRDHQPEYLWDCQYDF